MKTLFALLLVFGVIGLVTIVFCMRDNKRLATATVGHILWVQQRNKPRMLWFFITMFAMVTSTALFLCGLCAVAGLWFFLELWAVGFDDELLSLNEWLFLSFMVVGTCAAAVVCGWLIGRQLWAQNARLTCALGVLPFCIVPIFAPMIVGALVGAHFGVRHTRRIVNTRLREEALEDAMEMEIDRASVVDDACRGDE
jgi:ABC-type Fe3+ transport system permease subunit